MTFPLAAGLFLVFVGLVALPFGLYALLRGGRGQRGGIGPSPSAASTLLAGYG